MNFQQYKWSKNPRGLHNNPTPAHIYLDRYVSSHMGLAKLVAEGDEYVKFIRPLIDHGVTPIVRIFTGSKGSTPPPDIWDNYIDEYMAQGVLWFEIYNEPNQPVEWSAFGQAVDLNYHNVDGVIGPVMDGWLDWADKIIRKGAYPAFPALTETADPNLATIPWLDAEFKYLSQTADTRFRTIVDNGMWFATHPYLFNHWYQEPDGGPSYLARPAANDNANEGGWHFEYPYDPLQQHRDPGRTVFGGTALTPYGDPNGLLNTAVASQQLLAKYFGMGPVPVIGTEGGIDVPKDNRPLRLDNRYPAYDLQSHAEGTMAMWDWIVTTGPAWFFGLTLWLEDDYFFGDGTPIPAMQRMIDKIPLSKTVLSIDTSSGRSYPITEENPQASSGGGAPAAVPGPGPINGSPDYHWMVLAPGLQADWFFSAARKYWQTFRPTVLTDWRLIRDVPASKALAVTVLARTDTIDYLNKRIRDTWPNIYYDAVVYDSLDQMQAELDRRADALKRFG